MSRMRCSFPACFVISLGSMGAARGAEALFPVPAFPVGELPARVCPADFDGDGLADLAAASWDDNLLTVLHNTGGGIMSPWHSYMMDSPAYTLAAGDLDHDQDVDLVIGTSDYFLHEIAVWLNDGAGNLSEAGRYATTYVPVALALGDFDGDTHPDLAVGEEDDDSDFGTLSLWINLGDGTLTSGGTFGTDWTSSLAMADLDSDLDTDLLACAARQDHVRVWLNDGSGTFASAGTYPVFEPRGIACGDFDLDSDADFAVSRYGFEVHIFRNLGSGLFEFARNLGAGGGVGPIAALQLDPSESPPRVDLAAAIEMGGVYLFRNVGGCDFDEIAYLSIGERPASLAVADFDHDGDDDLASSNADGGDLTIMFGRGDDTMAAAENYSVRNYPNGLAAGDLSGDGAPELVAAHSGGGDSRLAVLPNNGFGTFGWYLLYDAWPGGGVVLANLDGDPSGRLDVAVASTNGDLVFVMLNQGAAGLAPPVSYATGDGPYGMCAADLDLDGDRDLAVANFYDSSVSILLNDGAAVFSEVAEYPTGAGSSLPRSIAALDIDADGDADLAVANADSGDWVILKNGGGAVFDPPVSYAIDGYGQSLATADFDRDGDPDVAVLVYRDAPEAHGAVIPWLNTGAGEFVAGAELEAGILPVALVAADLNADRSPDLAFSDHERGTIGVLLNLGDGTFGTCIEYYAGGKPGVLVATDVDLDGRVDLCTAINPGETVWVLRNQGPAAPPAPSCDVDQNGSTEDADFEAFLCCLAGPGVTVPPPACDASAFMRADADGDGDVDLEDLSIFQAGCAWGLQGAPPLTAYWAFDEGGGSVAHDAGGAYDAQVSGATWVSGYAGTALRFTGAAEAAIPAAFDDGVSGGLTVAAWVKWEGSSQLAYVLDSRGGNQSQGFIVMLDPASGQVRFYLYRPDGISTFVSTSGVAIGQWTHVAAVADFHGDAVRFYIDGQPAGGPTGYPHVYVPTTGGSATIGNNVYSGQDRPLSGALDELRVYHAALTAAEVWELYLASPRP